MKITKERILDEISNTSVVLDLFKKCNQPLQDLFLKLVMESSRYSCNIGEYVKNMNVTSIRLQKPYLVGRRSQNYCMFTLRPNSNYILVDIRTDEKLVDSEVLQLTKLRKGRYNGGTNWYRFIVKNASDIDEAIRLISICYEG